MDLTENVILAKSILDECQMKKIPVFLQGWKTVQYRFLFLASAWLILISLKIGAQEMTNSSMKTFMIYKFAQHIDWDNEAEIDSGPDTSGKYEQPGSWLRSGLIC